ncbi:hypothetical protein [Paracoccus litorisediminis]|uniref:Uncharacterized protein n=1 Tax=Paracoccus litorisediminis TaxID=2006130 RepID=A0A844HPU8_9RHOB|nr:hypothetical protein [Paracoccus litorisediminis]MTH61876.1 hypothetical protein [Paracoccus litorisediminis]
MHATLFLTGIEPVTGTVDPTPTGYVFSIDMVLPEGEMPRDNEARLDLADGGTQIVHLENVNVSQVASAGDEEVFRGTIILRKLHAPEP